MKAAFVPTFTLAAALISPPVTGQALTTLTVDTPVRALIAAMQAEDAPAIRAQFATSATQTYGAHGPMKSAAATAKWLESDIIERQGKLSHPEISVQGNQVVVRGQYNSKADFLFTVDKGLITSWHMRC